MVNSNNASQVFQTLWATELTLEKAFLSYIYDRLLKQERERLTDRTTIVTNQLLLDCVQQVITPEEFKIFEMLLVDNIEVDAETIDGLAYYLPVKHAFTKKKKKQHWSRTASLQTACEKNLPDDLGVIMLNIQRRLNTGRAVDIEDTRILLKMLTIDQLWVLDKVSKMTLINFQKIKGDLEENSYWVAPNSFFQQKLRLVVPEGCLALLVALSNKDQDAKSLGRVVCNQLCDTPSIILNILIHVV